LTHSGRLTHKVVTRQPWIRRRSGKVRRLQTDILTTEPRSQQLCYGSLWRCIEVNFFGLVLNITGSLCKIRLYNGLLIER